MKKTNCKVVELRVVEYLKEELESYEGGLYRLIEEFNDNNKYDYLGYTNIVAWAREMGNLFPIYYDDMRELLKEWLEETDEEANRFDNDQVAKTFDCLVDRVLMKYFKLHKDFKYDFRNQPYSKAYLIYVGGEK